LHKYGHDYKVIFVGDATMSPYEILQPGGSIEYFNEEPGAAWIKRVTDVYAKCVWLNPEPEEIWSYRQSIAIVKELMNGRMYPTTLEGLERAMRVLAKEDLAIAWGATRTRPVVRPGRGQESEYSFHCPRDGEQSPVACRRPVEFDADRQALVGQSDRHAHPGNAGVGAGVGVADVGEERGDLPAVELHGLV